MVLFFSIDIALQSTPYLANWNFNWNDHTWRLRLPKALFLAKRSNYILAKICFSWHSFIPIGVTRLGDFWKLLATNSPTKLAQIFVGFLEQFEKLHTFTSICCDYVLQLLTVIGLLLLYHLVTLNYQYRRYHLASTVGAPIHHLHSHSIFILHFNVHKNTIISISLTQFTHNTIAFFRLNISNQFIRLSLKTNACRNITQCTSLWVSSPFKYLFAHPYILFDSGCTFMHIPTHCFTVVVPSCTSLHIVWQWIYLLHTLPITFLYVLVNVDSFCSHSIRFNFLLGLFLFLSFFFLSNSLLVTFFLTQTFRHSFKSVLVHHLGPILTWRKPFIHHCRRRSRTDPIKIFDAWISGDYSEVGSVMELFSKTRWRLRLAISTYFLHLTKLTFQYVLKLHLNHPGQQVSPASIYLFDIL